MSRKDVLLQIVEHHQFVKNISKMNPDQINAGLAAKATIKAHDIDFNILYMKYLEMFWQRYKMSADSRIEVSEDLRYSHPDSYH
jgi:hypothetical protein